MGVWEIHSAELLCQGYFQWVVIFAGYHVLMTALICGVFQYPRGVITQGEFEESHWFADFHVAMIACLCVQNWFPPGDVYVLEEWPHAPPNSTPDLGNIYIYISLWVLVIDWNTLIHYGSTSCLVCLNYGLTKSSEKNNVWKNQTLIDFFKKKKFFF